MSRTMAEKAVVLRKVVDATFSEGCWTGTELIEAPEAGACEEFTTSPENSGEDAAEHLSAAAQRALRARGDALVEKLMDMALLGNLASGELVFGLSERKATHKETANGPLWHLLKRLEAEPEWPGDSMNEETEEVDAGDWEPEM